MIYIFGKGSYSREVADLVERCDKEKKYKFIDDNYNLQEDVMSREDLAKVYRSSDKLIVAIGKPEIRKEIGDWAKEYRYKLGRLIDPTSILGSKVVLGNGTIIFPFSSVSSETLIGENCVINWSTNVGHHVEIGENSFISSKVNIGGSCKIGKNCMIGMGALIREGVTIGENCVVGMGSVVFKDIPSGCKVVGNPGRITR